jgi:hypothetical protein
MIVDLDWKEYTDGEITLEVKPLSFQGFQKMQAFLGKNISLEDMKDEKQLGIAMDVFSNKELQPLVKQILPEHCRNLENVEIKIDGKIRKATIDDVVEHGVFTVLCMNILTFIFGISSLSRSENEEIKK